MSKDDLSQLGPGGPGRRLVHCAPDRYPSFFRVTLTVASQCAASGAQLIVAVTGPGVPAADRDRILQRFVRLDRGRTTNGHDLGLDLVAAITAVRGGRLMFEDNRPGLRAEIYFPCADE